MEVALRFDNGFGGRVEVGEEVESGESFYTVDADGGFLKSARDFFVWHDESDASCGFCVRRQDDFEVAVGDGYASVSDAFENRSSEDRSADDNQKAIGFCPVATFFFEVFPRSGVESFGLRADVGEVERVVHGISIPFHVASRSHVSAVVSRVAVVLQSGASGDFIIDVEVFFARNVAVEHCSCEFPCDPVGDMLAYVERDGRAFIIVDDS